LNLGTRRIRIDTGPAAQRRARVRIRPTGGTVISISQFSFDSPRFRALLEKSRETPPEVLRAVEGIVSDVRSRGDEALFECMRKYGQVELSRDTVKVSDEEYDEAGQRVSAAFAEGVKVACENLFKFHQHQLPKSYSVSYEHEVKLQRVYQPIERVGVCVPSGSAPLASSLYMNLVPALVAGVPEITIMAHPKGGRIDDHILYVADYLGVRNVYRISGAQGVAALAYGTDSVPRVDKIVGPGNIYTQTAKRLVFGTVGIDSIAGPSEIAIIADTKAPAAYVAADLLAQAEHGSGLETAVAFCTSVAQAEAISSELVGLIRRHDLGDAVSRALLSYGNIFVVDSLSTAVDAVNVISPEHLELMCEAAEDLLPMVRTSGAVFIGEYSTEPVGDYICGTNHVLPTAGTARFSSGLSVMDFLRGVSVVRYTHAALAANGASIRALAEAEGLRAHALAVAIRRPPAEKPLKKTRQP
jgi:histidinol dehydrogenase